MRCKILLQKTSVWFLCLLLCVTHLALPVSAYASINTQQATSLSIHFSMGEKVFSNVTFRLYKVAELSASGSYTLTGDFKNYPVQLEHLDSEGWRDLAETLSAYVARDKLSPVKESSTDAAGQLKFSELQVGLYLLLGENYQENTITYSPVPQFLTLPHLDENHNWEYDVVALLKGEISTNQEKTGDSFQVVIDWKDNGDKSKRPNQVVVELLQDGKVYDRVILNADNNWSYTWENLPEGYTWKVVAADTPEGYHVKISKDDGIFTITYTDKKPAGTTSPSQSQQSSASDSASGQSPALNATLPQTGVLWWPVPILAAAGMLLFFVGWRIWRNGDRTDD